MGLSRCYPKSPGLVFAGGAMAVALLLGYFWVWPPASGIIAARHWVETSCTIGTSKATRVDRNKYQKSIRYFDYALTYTFQVDGRTIVGDRRSFAEELRGQSNRFEEIAARYPAGSTRTCYYNPANPREAVLDRGINSTMWPAAIPLTLFALGLVFFVGNLVAGRSGAYSEMLAPGGANNLGYYLGGALVLVGVTLCYFVVAKPVMGMIGARSWVATPCTITGSSVSSGRVNGMQRTGGSYNWIVNYQYVANGKTIIRDRVSFWPQPARRKTAQEAKVAQYPTGATTTCYYNPANPNEAVLDRGVTIGAGFAFVALAAFGLGIVAIVGVRQRNRVRFS